MSLVRLLHRYTWLCKAAIVAFWSCLASRHCSTTRTLPGTVTILFLRVFSIVLVGIVRTTNLKRQVQTVKFKLSSSVAVSSQFQFQQKSKVFFFGLNFRCRFARVDMRSKLADGESALIVAAQLSDGSVQHEIPGVVTRTACLEYDSQCFCQQFWHASFVLTRIWFCSPPLQTLCHCVGPS